MTKSFPCAVSALAIAFAAFASAPAHAKTAKACEAEYQAGKADLQKAGTKKTDFMKTCRAQPEAKAAAKPDTKAADTKADKAAAKAAAKAKADADKADKKAKADTDKKAKAQAKADEKKAKSDKKAEPKAAAKPAEKPAPAAKPAATAKPAANEPDGKPGRVAFIARERACGSDWKADKAAGKTGEQKWPQYWSDCNKRKKTQGM